MPARNNSTSTALKSPEPLHFPGGRPPCHLDLFPLCRYSVSHPQYRLLIYNLVNTLHTTAADACTLLVGHVIFEPGHSFIQNRNTLVDGQRQAGTIRVLAPPHPHCQYNSQMMRRFNTRANQPHYPTQCAMGRANQISIITI